MVGVINRSFEVVGNIMKRAGGGMIPNDHSHDCELFLSLLTTVFGGALFLQTVSDLSFC